VAAIPSKRLLALELPDDEATAFEPRPLWRRIIPGGELRGGTVTSDGQLFAVDTDLTLHVFDLTTGDVLHERALPAHGDAAPSLSVAGGHVFIPLDSGEVVVINAVPPYDQVADNVLGGLGQRCAPPRCSTDVGFTCGRRRCSTALKSRGSGRKGSPQDARCQSQTTTRPCRGEVTTVPRFANDDQADAISQALRRLSLRESAAA
jgi:hypothetical protein